MIDAAYLALVVAAACFGIRMVQGPTMADRVVGLNGLVVVGMGAIAANAVDTGRGAFLPVLVVLALVGFLGTAMVARYIESRGR
jgi:multicomponent Na+:H+ antiporter subunit F